MTLDDALDPELCVVERSADFFSPGGDRIYYLCEAFGNNEAAGKAGLIARELVRAGATCICIEAVSEHLDAASVDALCSKPPGSADLADALSRGEINLLQYLALAEGGFEVHGVEDQVLYRETVALGTKLTPGRTVWMDRLAAVIDTLRRDPNHILSPRYARFTSELASYGSDGLPGIMELVDYTMEARLEAKTRNVRQLQDVRRLEDLIDFDEANRELRRLVDVFDERSASREAILRDFLRSIDRAPGAAPTHPTLVARLLQFGLKRRPELARRLIDPRGVHELFETSLGLANAEVLRALTDKNRATLLGVPALTALVEYMLALGIPLDRFHNLIRYVHYVARVRRIDLVHAVQEWRTLTNQVASHLAATSDDRRHATLVEALTYVRRVFGLACTQEDLVWTRSNRLKIEFDTIASELRSFLNGLAIAADFERLGREYAQRLETAIAYYDQMASRANAMAHNTYSYCQTNGLREVVLATGGFHRGTIKSRLESLPLKWAIITPRFSHESTEEELFRYFESLSSRWGVAPESTPP